MMNLPARLLPACALLLLAGCRLLTGSEEGNPCPRTTAGSGGCARIALVIDPPSSTLRDAYGWEARARPARDGTDVEVVVAGPAHPGRVHLTPMHSSVGAGAGDTVSLWVSARALNYRGVVFAMDSALHVARFAPVGSQAPVDTVRLAPR